VEARVQFAWGWRMRARTRRALPVAVALWLLCASSAAAAPPTVGGVWASNVQPTTVRLNAEVDPKGKTTTYRFEYLTKAAYEGNVAASKDPFTGASKLPVSGETPVAGTIPTSVFPSLFGLAAGTTYRYRILVKNADGATAGPTREVRTFSAEAPFVLPDGRGWEMVSPVEKNGGQIASLNEAGAGPSRAATGGDAVAYASRGSFAGGGGGASPFSAYIARRGLAGWGTENITPAHLTGAYEGSPFEAFSADIARGLYLNPSRCPVGDPCTEGHQLRDSATAALTPSPAEPGTLVAASEDLARLVFADGGQLNLWTPPFGSVVSLNPTPPVASDPPFGAISAEGARIYYQGEDGNLHLREGAITEQVDAGAGGGGSFESTTQDGAVALYSKAGHLYRYQAATDANTDIVPEGGVVAGSAILAARKVLFASAEPLLTSNGERYDNLNANTKAPEPQVYLLDLASAELRCLSCNPTNARPIGPSQVPGGAGTHRPRAVVANGARVYFDSKDALALSDVNVNWDVYQWTAPGAFGCSNPPGCLALISSGLANRATFIDASASGDDVFFITDRSLVGTDPDSVDLYDARVGGGFPEPIPPSPCIGDACQVVPPAMEDPVLTTVLSGPGNPAERYRAYGDKARCPKGKALKTVKSKGRWVQKCVKKKRGRGR